MDEKKMDVQTERDIDTGGDMEILDMEPVVREFVRRSDSQRTLQKKRRKRNGEFPPKWLWPGVAVVLFVTVNLCGIPITGAGTAILIAVLEVILALCLFRAPLWMHVFAIAVNVVLGIIFELLLYMLLASLVYAAAAWAFYMWERR